jgi:hypothetical protein
MTLNLVADQIVRGKIYPALTQHQAHPYTPEWRQFGQYWPYTTPLRLQEYCQEHAVKINICTISDPMPDRAFYPIGIGFFNFEIDYFFLLPNSVKQLLKSNRIKLLFMYHEGDNPRAIKHRLDSLCIAHQLDCSCYVFVSSNTAAERLPGFVLFNDFELWYFQRNLSTSVKFANMSERSKDFTMLSRIHKSWRAAIVADLKRNNVLENSYWSYCETGEYVNDNPIEIDSVSQLRWHTTNFLSRAPYTIDELTQDQRNDHSHFVSEFYTDSYCNIVLESQFDVDGSSGAFLTEKTFKPIKHGQLFFIAGGPGSLQAIRNLGYRTFDNLLDNSYDQEQDHTVRWIKLKNSIIESKSSIKELYQAAIPDIVYNQQLFLSSKQERLNNLIRKINEQYC